MGGQDGVRALVGSVFREGGLMRYGVPYKGSKNQIAEWVVDNLPKAEYFVDLFCGGCAVTHRALISGKYQRFIINDIDGRMPKLFLDAVHGKYTVENHPEWVSREEFHKLKDSDAYVAMIWSFGNNGKDYIYGRNGSKNPVGGLCGLYGGWRLRSYGGRKGADDKDALVGSRDAVYEGGGNRHRESNQRTFYRWSFGDIGRKFR
jgi:hypothetical protein